MTNKKLCAGITAVGNPCHSYPLTGSAFCLFHDSSLGARALRWSKPIVDKDLVRRLRHDELLTLNEIALLVGCTRQNISNILGPTPYIEQKRIDKRLREAVSQLPVPFSISELAKLNRIYETKELYKIARLEKPDYKYLGASLKFWFGIDVLSKDECWNWLGAAGPGGYGVCSIRSVFPKERATHRIAWTLCNGEIPEDMWVLHRCNNPLCCNPSHLYLGTALDNAQDREKLFDKGRPRRLTAQQVRRMKKLVANNTWSIAAAAKLMRVSYAVARNAVIGKTYKWVIDGERLDRLRIPGFQSDIERLALLGIRPKAIARRLSCSIQTVYRGITILRSQGLLPLYYLSPSRAKLTESQVLEILGRSSEKAQDLANFYGVGRGCIYDIFANRTWKHIPREMIYD